MASDSFHTSSSTSEMCHAAACTSASFRVKKQNSIKALFANARCSAPYLLAGIVSAESHLRHFHFEVISSLPCAWWERRNGMLSGRIPADFKLLPWSTQKSGKFQTFYVEDAVSQGPSDGGEGRLFWHVEEEFCRGLAGDGFDFFDQVFCVDIVSYVITQDLETHPNQSERSFSSGRRRGERGSSLTAMPNLVMPFSLHSAMTESLESPSWDSPSVMTTITLAAPGRPPLLWWKPHWLTGANRQVSQSVNGSENRGHTRTEGGKQQTNLAYWMAWKVLVECPYTCVILDAAVSNSSLVLYWLSRNSNLGLTAYWRTLTWREGKHNINPCEDQRRRPAALAALTCVLWGPMSREGINFWRKAVIGSQG